MAEREELPDELRCNWTDGWQWRCNRRVTDGKKLCEIHYLQGRHRQHKEKVPDSLKLERKSKKPRNQESLHQIQEIRAKRSDKTPNPAQKSSKKGKRKRTIDVSEALDEALKKMKLKRGDLQLELIREFLKRQVEEKKERQLQRESEGDLLRELPYGVMAISQLQSPQNFGNAGGSCNVKLGSVSNSLTRRCFRSKNIEPLPICTMQILPCARNVVKRYAEG